MASSKTVLLACCLMPDRKAGVPPVLAERTVAGLRVELGRLDEEMQAAERRRDRRAVERLDRALKHGVRARAKAATGVREADGEEGGAGPDHAESATGGRAEIGEALSPAREGSRLPTLRQLLKNWKPVATTPVTATPGSAATLPLDAGLVPLPPEVTEPLTGDVLHDQRAAARKG